MPSHYGRIAGILPHIPPPAVWGKRRIPCLLDGWEGQILWQLNGIKEGVGGGEEWGGKGEGVMETAIQYTLFNLQSWVSAILVSLVCNAKCANYRACHSQQLSREFDNFFRSNVSLSLHCHCKSFGTKSLKFVVFWLSQTPLRWCAVVVGMHTIVACPAAENCLDHPFSAFG